LARQRSASESVLVISRKSSFAPASQSSENLSTPNSPFEPPANEDSSTSVEDQNGIQTVHEEPKEIEDAAAVPLPSPVNTDLEETSQEIEEADDLFERPSRRHTLIATSPTLQESTWATIEESSSSASTSPSKLHLPVPNFLETSSSQSSDGQPEGCSLLPEVDEETRQRELIMSMKQLSESETELQRTHSALLGDSLNKPIPPLRHVVSLNLLRANKMSDDLNGPPSARSLPLEHKPGIRRRVSSRLRFSFRRKSTDLDGLMGESYQSPLEPPVEPSPDTPPQLAPLLFDSLSLDPAGSGVEGDLPLNKLNRFSTDYKSNRQSLHTRSRSTPLLFKDPSLSLSTTLEGKSTDRRTSITAEHNLLLLPSLHTPQLSPAPKLDIVPPSQSDDDWLQSVLKAAASS